jgi:exopolysaccharide biosynthesis polyprenyl glycosylphosphotransferase
LSAVSEDVVVVQPQDSASQGSPVVSAPPLRRRGWLMRRLLLVGDIAGLTTAFVLGLTFFPSEALIHPVDGRVEVLLFILSLPFWVVLARVHGLYDRDEERTDHSTVDDLFGVFQVVSLGTWGILVVTEVTALPQASVPRLTVFWVLAIILVPFFRAVMRMVGRRRAAYVQNVIIVGTGHVARLLAAKIAKHPEYGLRVVGFVDRDDGAAIDGGHLDLIGTTADLATLVRSHSAHRVAIAFSTESHEETLEVIRSMQESDVQIDIVPRMFEVLGTNAQLHTIEGLPLVGLPIPRLSASSRFLKRSLDLFGSVAGLVLLSPLLVLTALSIKLDSRGPVFFRQVRMGEEGKAFEVLKFRTMIEEADSLKTDLAHLNMHGDDPRMFKLPNDPRVTRAGAFLRRWRIDELPQLLNVLRGEMSLVGPRPLILDEDQYVERWARRRLRLKPGMTGLWQVLGASDIPFDEMTKLDYLYVTNWSLREDVRLILLTLPAMTRVRAAY